MSTITAVILLAGVGSRMNNQINKVYLNLDNKKVINHSLDKFIKIKQIEEIILVYNPNDIELLKQVLLDYEEYNIKLVEGGKTRNNSVCNALNNVSSDYVLIHDGARPYTKLEDIYALINALNDFDAVSLYHDCVDAIKYKGKSLNKNDLIAVTTPQGFNRNAYTYILNNQNCLAFDELEILENSEYKIGYIKETSDNKKITYSNDLLQLEYKIGYSMDFHPFVAKDYLILGGVKIPSKVGLKGHSDADSVYHALTEAILGSLHLGDMGYNYPDNDPKYKDYDSSLFLKDAKTKLENNGYAIANIDIMIYLESPKLKNYKFIMEENIAQILEIDSSKVSVKATTFEKKGVIGSNEGVAAEAFVLIKKQN